MKLRELPCTHCQGAGLELHGPYQAQCRYCGTPNTISGVVCPRCEEINPPQAEACAACQQGLVRRCPDCATANWSGADHCAQCGRALDTMSVLGARLATSYADRLHAQGREAAAIKAREAEDSERRMGELQAIEARRQAALAEARRRRDQQQRALVVVVSVVVLAFLGLAAVIGVLSMMAN